MIRSGIKWMFLIIGTMIGAGYASGRELWQFFGHESGLAILIFTILFTISCYVILRISFEKKSKHYLPVLRTIVGDHLTFLYDGMIILYLFTTTVIMLAGSGATWQAFHFSYWLGIFAIVVPLILVFIWDIKGILSMNSFILPLLIGGLLYVLILFTVQQELSIFSHLGEQRNWPAAFPFTALNILPLIAVLGAVGSEVRNKGEIWIASVGSGLVLGLISFIYNSSLIQIADDILLYEIPLFAILKHYPYEMFLFISFLLWIAIFTTAASGVLGLITRFRNRLKGPLWFMAACTLFLMLPLTSIGFSTLIKYLYPLYGLLNLYVLSAILLYPFLNRYKID
ncbi:MULTISPECIES: YkvI family membrane protein [Pontibacillus]|uniref:Membrane protein YkvI n=1 Tax=Pontibacillus chungwhensis TaxID=265426 RepID=A0ABY8UYP6_9BACI|nr:MULTISPECIES: hypothetical protein [Pontibacillus]MCD5325625.1 hypothetical protein [Pontibacillus sp. HN14]WIF98127.1 hypothetical protein QNI29_20820 [Pontibacillus chungwhensis]